MNLKDLEPEYLIHMEMKNGKFSMNVQGNTVSLLTATSSLVNKLKDNGIPEELIKKSVETGLIPEEQLLEETEKKLKNILNKIFD